MSKLICIVIMVFLSVSAFSAEPPEKQPGDDETMEITVYQARQALWYKEQHKVLTEWVEELEYEIKTRDKNIDILTEANDKLRKKVKGQRVGLYILGGVSLAGVVTVTVMALTCK